MVYDFEQLKYPIGKFKSPTSFGPEEFAYWINEISELPTQLEKLIDGLSNDQLSLPYRPDGWTIRQVVHHLPDSHANGYIRLKLALTEDNPTIKPYREERWAQLPDIAHGSIVDSVMMLKGVHARWSILLKHLSPSDFERTFYHPDDERSYSLKIHLPLYVWHGNHHLAHIEQALRLNGTF